MRALENIVEPHPVTHILGAGLLLTVLPLAGTWVAVGWGDALLVALSVALGGATAAAAHARGQLDRLPLELAPQVARGSVDGRDTLRFRACLGRGRACRPRWAVTFHPTEGPARPLTPWMPIDHVCGPFVAQVDAPAEAGRYEVVVSVGDERVHRAYAPDDLVDGRFVAGIHPGRRVTFDDGWRQVEPSDG